MTTLYTDLQKLVQEHCDAVVCVNGSMLAKDLRALLALHKPSTHCENCGVELPEVRCNYCGHPHGQLGSTT